MRRRERGRWAARCGAWIRPACGRWCRAGSGVRRSGRCSRVEIRSLSVSQRGGNRVLPGRKLPRPGRSTSDKLRLHTRRRYHGISVLGVTVFSTPFCPCLCPARKGTLTELGLGRPAGGHGSRRGVHDENTACCCCRRYGNGYRRFIGKRGTCERRHP